MTNNHIVFDGKLQLLGKLETVAHKNIAFMNDFFGKRHHELCLTYRQNINCIQRAVRASLGRKGLDCYEASLLATFYGKLDYICRGGENHLLTGVSANYYIQEMADNMSEEEYATICEIAIVYHVDHFLNRVDKAKRLPLLIFWERAEKNPLFLAHRKFLLQPENLLLRTQIKDFRVYIVERNKERDEQHKKKQEADAKWANYRKRKKAEEE